MAKSAIVTVSLREISLGIVHLLAVFVCHLLHYLTLGQLHVQAYRLRIAGKYRQPDDKQHCDNFPDESTHEGSLAKITPRVNH
jgi:hypothetical protein